MEDSASELQLKVAALTRELGEARAQQAATADVLKVISSSGFELDAVLTTLIRSAIELCEAARGVIWLRRREQLILAAHVDYPPEWVDFAKANPITPSADAQTISGIAGFTGEVVNVEDIFADPRFRSLAGHALGNYRAGLAVPLKRDGHVVGVISLSRPDARLFTERQVALVQTFADQAVIAIENVRLFEEVQARNHELSEALEQQTATSAILQVIASSPTDIQPVLKAVTESAAKLCDAYDATTFFRRGDILEVGAHHGPISVDFGDLPVARDVVSGRAVLDREPVHVHDLQETGDEFDTGKAIARRLGFRTILSMPLIREGEAIGALMIRRSEVRPFSDKQIALLKTFADQAVIAIENARLFEAVKQRTEELSEALQQQTAMSEILRVISRSPTDIQPVFETIAESAARLCQARFCAVFRFDGELIHFMAQHGMSPEADDLQRRAFPSPPGRTSAAARAMLSGRVEQVPDVEADADFALGPLTKAMGIRGVVSVPMLRDGRPVGAINITRAEPGHFPDGQIELLKTFADQAVIAIENVRLFDEVQARTHELTESLMRQTAASEILRVIARSPTDVQPVFDTIATSVAQLCAARYCIVFGFDGELVHFVAEHGLPPEAVAHNREAYPMPPGRGSAAARAIFSRTVEQIPDVEADPDFAHTSIARRARVRSLIGVPMLKDDVPAGAIVVARPQTGLLPDRQIDLLKTFADQAVIAIENVRLFEEVQARNRDLTESLERQTAMSDILRVISRSPTDVQPVFETIAESAARLCGGHFCTVFRFDGELIHFVAQHGLPPEGVEEQRRAFPKSPGRGSGASRAIRSAAVEQIPDVNADPDYQVGETARAIGARSVLAVPMLRDGRPVGSINIGRAEPGYFPPRQVELLQTFADQAVIAIENVRLFEAVQAKTRDLEESLTFQKATSSVLEVIGRSASNLQPVFDVILDTAADLCHADMSVLRLMRDGALHHVADSRRNDPAIIQHSRLNPILPTDRSSVAGRVALAGQTVHIPDVAEDEELTFLRPLDSQIGSLLGVPLIQDGKVAGVIALLRRVAQPFTQRQIELVETFADQAVIAIENVRLFEEVQARTAELGEALQQQTATADVLKVISRSAFDLQTVLDTLVESAVRLCRADKGGILRPFDGVFRYVALYGYPPAFQQVMEANPPAAGRGSAVGRVVEERKTVHILDALADPDYSMRAVAEAGDFRTILAIPLLREGDLIGVFAMTRAAAQSFTGKDIDLVQTFADQAVIAIENARLFDEVQARTTELTESLQQQTATADVLKVISRSTFDLQVVLDTLLESAARLCRADKADIVRFIDGQFQYVAMYGYTKDYEEYARTHPLEVGRGSANGRAMAEKRTIHIADIRADPEYRMVDLAAEGNFRTVLAVPLLREGSLIGIIALMRAEPQPFADKEIELVTTFADQAVIAVENVRLFTEVDTRNRELQQALEYQTATSEVLNVISRSPAELQPVLDVIVQTAVRLCEADFGTIARERDGIFVRTGQHGSMSPEFRDLMSQAPVEMAPGSITGRALVEGKVVHVLDAKTDPAYTWSDALALEEIRTGLGVPLLREGMPIGVIALVRRTVRPFTEKQIELVTTFADQAVIAIENARLFNEVQARTEELSRSLNDLRTAQDRLIQTEKLASLGQLTAGIAHEIKNPLNFVNNFSSLSGELIDELREALANIPAADKLRAEISDLTSMLKSNLEKVVQHGRRADSIVKNMLLHSRAGSGEHRPSDINAIVEESLNLAYHGARAEKQGFNITMEKSLDPAAGEVDLFPQEITRVLLNLISNGFYAATKRKAQADGGGFEPVLAAATRSLGDRVEIRIRDNGTGIPPEVKEKMFNPFFTTKPAGEGTGLGLSLSHDIIVKQHAGTIEVDTEPGKFTEFRIVLPRAAASLGDSGGRA